jgi:3-oxoacyl-[acyl-carrier-protein] synthase III
MTALDEVSAYLPPASVPIEAVVGPEGLPAGQARIFRRFYGLDQVRWDADAGLAEILLSAARKLTTLPGREHLVRYVIAARTLQAVAPPHVSILGEVCGQLGLTHANAFAVTQHACASGLLAVDLAGRLLAADGDPAALALVLAGEKAFTPTAQSIPSTTVMGEGTAAVLVSLEGTGDQLLSYATCTRGEYSNGLFLSADLAARFQQEYPQVLGEVMRAAVARAGLELADIDLLLPHNVNRVSWVRLCQQLGYPLERVFLDNIPVTGHCFCADPFINLHSAMERGRLVPGDRYLAVAVGLGSTFSAMVFEH